MPWFESTKQRDARLRAEMAREEREQAARQRSELLRVAASIQVERADVIRLMAQRHPEKDGAPAAELHALFDATAAEMAIKRARALVAAVDEAN